MRNIISHNFLNNTGNLRVLVSYKAVLRLDAIKNIFISRSTADKITITKIFLNNIMANDNNITLDAYLGYGDNGQEPVTRRIDVSTSFDADNLVFDILFHNTPHFYDSNKILSNDTTPAVKSPSKFSCSQTTSNLQLV